MAIAKWHSGTLQGVRDSKLGAPIASRVVAIVHTCMYDAWAAYDEKAVGTQLGGALRRPASERTEANKEKAISYAAYRALTDLFPGDTETVYKPLMRQLGYDPDDKSTDIETPTGIGNVACAAVLEYRHHDGANQLGDFEADSEKSRLEAGVTKSAHDAGAPYEDWSGYRAVNGPGTVPARATFTKPLNPDRWQPLTYTDAAGNLVVQMFAVAQWGFVKPFSTAESSMTTEQANGTEKSRLEAVLGQASATEWADSEVGRSNDEERTLKRTLQGPDDRGDLAEPGPAKYGSPEYEKQAEELIGLSANLIDKQKMLAEYWSEAAGEEPAAARWMRFAEFVSERDHHTLDDDVKMFFVLSNAIMDADIAAWDAKRAYDSVRPATAVPLLFRGKKIRAWGGPRKGTVEMDGGQWVPYQPATSPTPASPEFVSETSAESAAAARVLALWSGSDGFGYSVAMVKGSSKIEPSVTPAVPIVVKWATFTEAADDAGMAGRYGGIQFARGDEAGRKLGRLAAEKVWDRAQSYFAGNASTR